MRFVSITLSDGAEVLAGSILLSGVRASIISMAKLETFRQRPEVESQALICFSLVWILQTASSTLSDFHARRSAIERRRPLSLVIAAVRKTSVERGRRRTVE